MEREDALRKIRACMNLAENDAAQGDEVDNALRMAQKLMKKFAIDMAELLQSGKTVQFDFVEDAVNFGNKVKKTPLWYQWMAVQVAKFTDTIAVGNYDYVEGAGIRYKGHREDVVFACWLLNYLKDRLRDATRKANCGSPEGRETFRKAFARGVLVKLRDIQTQRPKELPKNALIVVDTKIAERDKHFGGESYRTTKSRSTFKDFDNYIKGFNAGKSVTINKPIGN
jgi:hypothetical protein